MKIERSDGVDSAVEIEWGKLGFGERDLPLEARFGRRIAEEATGNEASGLAGKTCIRCGSTVGCSTQLMLE